jgi:hypothetical protein
MSDEAGGSRPTIQIVHSDAEYRRRRRRDERQARLIVCTPILVTLGILALIVWGFFLVTQSD